MRVHMSAGRSFSRGATSGFFQKFFYGGKKWWNLVFTTQNLENSIFCWNFQIPARPSSDAHMLVCKKRLCHTIKKFG